MIGKRKNEDPLLDLKERRKIKERFYQEMGVLDPDKPGVIISKKKYQEVENMSKKKRKKIADKVISDMEKEEREIDEQLDDLFKK